MDMATKDPDRFLKRLWLINGICLMLLFIALAVTLIRDATRVTSRPWEELTTVAVVPETDTESKQPRAVRYDEPQTIHGSETRLISVRHGQGYYDLHDTSAGFFAVGYSSSSGPVVNAIFVQPDGEGHLLFDRPAIVLSIKTPPRDLSGQEWIAFQVVFEDTNGNGRLDRDDRRDLIVTNLKGFGAQRVLDDGYDVTWFGPTVDGTEVIVYALQVVPSSAKNDLRQRAFVFDPALGQLQPYGIVNELSEAAGTIFGR